MEVYSEHLAKLFATENIKVELKPIQTAHFDVVKSEDGLFQTGFFVFFRIKRTLDVA